MQARPFLSFPLLQTHTEHTPTYTHTHTPWPPADCVWTPGQDLKAGGIPEGWELNSPDYPIQST